MSDNHSSLEQIFDAEIASLVDRIKDLCQANGIPYFMVFQLEELKLQRPSLFKKTLHAVYGYIPAQFAVSSTMQNLKEMFPQK